MIGILKGLSQVFGIIKRNFDGLRGNLPALINFNLEMRTQLGAASNRAYAQHDGVLIARLSPAELMLLSNPLDPSLGAMTDSREATYRCYAVRRQDSHYWFALTGACSPATFAKLCSVDLSPDYFADHTVAQTSVARTSAIIVRHDINGTLCYYLLGDSSTIRYMRACLTDAMCEFDGQILGVQALEDPAAPPAM